MFVQVIKDRYSSSNEADTRDANSSNKYNNGSEPFIRRPTNGIQLKNDTFATIRVVTAEGGVNKLLIDAGSRRKGDSKDASGVVTKTNDYFEYEGKRATDIYSNFLLQQVQEDRQEKQQVLETFGEAYIFLFGERARVISFQGILANTFDFNWEAEWWHNYENFLRGTKCVENDARVYISYDNTLVGGYILSTASSKETMSRNHVTFQFQLFVTYYSNFSDVGDPNPYNGFPIDNLHPTPEYLKQWRPELIDYKIPLNPGGISGPPGTLFSAIESGFSAVKDAWGKLDQVVNSTLNAAQGLLDGGVRVPVGFAGSTIFNDEVTLATPNETSQAIVFSTFADNDVEYVGVGSHYGVTTGKLLDFGGNMSAMEEITYNQEMVDRATDLWAVGGKFVVPLVELGPLSKFLVSKAVGLAGVGATAAWQGASTALKAGSANPPTFAGDLSHAAVPVGVPFPPSTPVE